MVLFWTRGFEATSIQDVVDATGVGRGSLYATFRDKNRLFLTVVDHYLETVARSCG
jgi:TetR/AcrR family transcriptional repressor of nem operon